MPGDVIQMPTVTRRYVVPVTDSEMDALEALADEIGMPVEDLAGLIVRERASQLRLEAEAENRRVMAREGDTDG